MCIRDSLPRVAQFGMAANMRSRRLLLLPGIPGAWPSGGRALRRGAHGVPRAEPLPARGGPAGARCCRAVGELGQSRLSVRVAGAAGAVRVRVPHPTLPATGFRRAYGPPGAAQALLTAPHGLAGPIAFHQIAAVRSPDRYR